MKKRLLKANIRKQNINYSISVLNGGQSKNKRWYYDDFFEEWEAYKVFVGIDTYREAVDFDAVGVHSHHIGRL